VETFNYTNLTDTLFFENIFDCISDEEIFITLDLNMINFNSLRIFLIKNILRKLTKN